MITVLCLTPCVDETIYLPTFVMGGTNRPRYKQSVAGGKGVNVAVTLAQMGEEVTLATYRYEKNSELLMETIAAAGLQCVAIDTPGTLRTNLKIMDQSTSVITEINMKGEAVSDEAVAAMEDALLSAARKSSWVVLTGSLPKDFPVDFYARVIRRIRAEKLPCRVALDAEGAPLTLGVKEKPDFIKPNRHELELLLNRPLPDNAAIAEAAREVAAMGVGNIIVSMDSAGSMLMDGDEAVFAPAVPVDVVTTVGAGDALVSGFLIATAQGENARNAFRRGVACATARVAGEDGQTDKYLPLVQFK